METTMKEKKVLSEGWIRLFQELYWMLKSCAPFAPWKSLYDFAATMPWLGLGDALYTFVKTPDLFRFDYDLYMPLDDFKWMYTEFRRANEYERIRWTKAHYDVFREFGIVKEKETRWYDGRLQLLWWAWIFVIECLDPRGNANNDLSDALRPLQFSCHPKERLAFDQQQTRVRGP